MTVPGLIAQLEASARTRLDRATYDYVAGGSGGEVALAEGPAAWQRYRLAPHVLRDVSRRSAAVSLFGAELPSPVGCAPVGYQRLLHPDGEVAVATGADGHLVVLSARTDAAIEDVAAARAGRPWWYQHYVTADRRVGDAALDRAVAAGAAAIVLTGDTPYVATKARQGRLRAVPPGADQAPATLADLDRLLARELPVLVKGVLRADDASEVIAAGASGVIVSNHGGRQLDRAVATADVLADVVAAAGGAPVLVDGGLRSGHDVLVALALGARAVLVGRPVAWALAAAGADGVRGLLDAFTAETVHVLGLTGHPDVASLRADTPSILPS